MMHLMDDVLNITYVDAENLDNQNFDFQSDVYNRDSKTDAHHVFMR